MLAEEEPMLSTKNLDVATVTPVNYSRDLKGGTN